MVTDEYRETSRRTALQGFLHVMDEPGEFLYGGNLMGEIKVCLEEKQLDGTWKDITPA